MKKVGKLIVASLAAGGVYAAYKAYKSNKEFISEDSYKSKNFLKGTDASLEEGVWSLGYAKGSIAPNDLHSKDYYVAGYFAFPAMVAKEIIDDICVRAICINDGTGSGTVAFAAVDCIGLSNSDIRVARDMLKDFTQENNIVSINIASTHIHSGIDTQGIWGPFLRSGRNEPYIRYIQKVIKDTVIRAYEDMTEGKLYYSECSLDGFVRDPRKPKVFDNTLHRMRFQPKDSTKCSTYIINMGAHPINMGESTPRITADYPYYIDEKISSHGANCMFFQGAIGGGVRWARSIHSGEGEPENIELIKSYGRALGDLAYEAKGGEEEIKASLEIRMAEIKIPFKNPLLRVAGKLKIVKGTLVVNDKGEVFGISEVGYLRLGKKINAAFVPGELFPEIAFGGAFSAEDSALGTEYEEDSLRDIIAGQGEKFMVFGLMNDAIGYILPDNDFLRDITKFDPHYEEWLSYGPNTASTIAKAFKSLAQN